jgi:zinc-ribbon domain
MSSVTSTDSDRLQPWQLFTLAGLAGAMAVVFASNRLTKPEAVLLSLTVIAAAYAGLAAWRTFAPFAGHQEDTQPEILGGRTRAALEREKTLVLRSIKELEFDRAMGKIAEGDFDEMSARLRQRAARLLRQLDRGAGYRDEIEKELEHRIGAPLPKVAHHCTACGTVNDRDARFCKQCGTRLEAP